MRGALRLLVLLSVGAAAPALAQERSKIVSVEIEGRLIDPKERLERFLGLTPGAEIDTSAQDPLFAALKALGYAVEDLQLTPVPGGIAVKLKVAPMRVVRGIKVHGNFPLFDDEILRHLQMRSGFLLPPDDELAEFLQVEADRVRSFLERDGYFQSKVRIIPRQGPHQEWVDLDIRIELGDWYKIGSIALAGKHPIREAELYDLFANHCCFRWGRFTIDRMREDARRAEKQLRERGYPAARVVPDFDFARDADRKTRRIRLPVTVNEKRKVLVSFVGNRNIPDRELRDQLTIFTTGAYDEVEIADSARAVQRYYQQHGYFEAKVTHRKQRSADLEEVTFFLEEGPELKVRAVDVASESGQSLRFSDAEIKSKAGVETKPYPVLGVIGLGSGGYVTNLQLQQDAERIAAFYKKRGFDQVKVRGEVARDPASFSALGALGAETAGAIEKRDDLFVRFFVDEGRQRLVEDIVIEFKGPGHRKSEQEVRTRLKLARGSAYSEESATADGESILSLYKNSGQPYAEVDAKQSRWNATGDRIHMVWQVREDGEVTFGEIIVRGNFITLERVIRKDLPFKTGARYDESKIEEGARNLRTHLIFNTVEVKPLGREQGRNPVPILVLVQERYTKYGSPWGAVGVSTDKLPNYAYLQGGWIWNNVFGLGSQLELRGETGFDANSWGFNLRYTDLRAFGPGWRADAEGFYRRDVTIRLGPIETYGLRFGITRYLTQTTRLYGRYDIYRAQIGVGFYRISGPNDQSTVNDNTTTSKITFGVVWDRRVGADGQPNPLAPVKGWLLSASVGWATPPPVGDHQFFVLSAQAIGLVPFKVRSSELTLLANLRIDEGIPIGEAALPVVERFFAGGDTTTRGYDTDQLKNEIIASRVPPLQGGQAFRVIPQGGNIRVLSTIELQFPIAKTFLGLPFPWAGAIFYDAGAIADAPNLFGWSDIKHSIGISLLRLLTPVGPLSFEYAYPLSQSLAEERWKTSPWYSHYPGRIHFNWGIPLSR